MDDVDAADHVRQQIRAVYQGDQAISRGNLIRDSSREPSLTSIMVAAAVYIGLGWLLNDIRRTFRRR
jgi:hypothetical protein